MELDDLRCFAKVAELASFTRAAEHLGLAKGRVSSAVQRLEQRLGTRLLLRTTRTVRLTPDGEAFVERCRDLLDDAEQLQTLFQPDARGLRGRLRIDMPTSFARDLVIPRLPEFLAVHPQLEMSIGTADRYVDVVQEGFDCVLRVGTLVDSRLVARPVGQMPQANAASPAYLDAFGTPRTLSDLSAHRVVHYAAALNARGAGLEYMAGGERRLWPMRAAVTVNGIEAYQAACLAGLGLIQAPRRALLARFADGSLVEVLPRHVAPPLPVTLLYPERRHLPNRVQVFMTWLVALLQERLEVPAVARQDRERDSPAPEEPDGRPALR